MVREALKQIMGNRILRIHYQNYDVVAFVEGISDPEVWRKFFELYNNASIKVIVTDFIGDVTNMIDGKDNLKMLYNEYNKILIEESLPNDIARFFFCFDSDYDYLTNSEWYKELCGPPEILQTYAHSHENYLCIPEVIEKMTTNIIGEPSSFNFQKFLRRLSYLFYELLVVSCISAIRGINPQVLKKENLLKTFEFPKHIASSKQLETDYFIFLEARVQKLLSRLDSPIDTHQKQEFKKQLAECGVNKDNAFLYIQGHLIFDAIMVHVIRIVLKEELKNKIKFLQTSRIPEQNRRALEKKYVERNFSQDILKYKRNNYSTSMLMIELREKLANCIIHDPNYRIFDLIKNDFQKVQSTFMTKQSQIKQKEYV